MAHRQQCELHPPGIEETVGSDEQRIRPVQVCKRRIDFTAGASFEGLDLQRSRPNSGVCVIQYRLGTLRIGP
jgi:hypothetical protein